MNDLFQNSLFAGVTISLLAYLAGSILKKKFKLGIFNPLLISIVLTIVVLVCARVDYETYNKGAQYLSWFLTPATVCLAIPLYEQWELLKRSYKAVILGITSGVLTSLGTVFVLAKIMGLKTILKGVEQIKGGVSVFVFPEGTRSKDGKMLPFKEGSMKMAEKSKSPIIPVALTGTADIFENHFPKVKRGKVTIDFGKPIIIEELDKEDKKFLGTYTQRKIQEMLDERA